MLSVSSESGYDGQVVPPFGLMSLGSYVRSGEYEIKGIDMNGPPDIVRKRYRTTDAGLLQSIRDFAPDLVAMTAYAFNIHNVMFWAAVIKSEFPQSVVVLGGNYASYIGREILEACGAVDLVIRFEGEIAFERLCRVVASGSRDFRSVPNAVFRDGGEIVETDVLPALPTLDALPIMDRSFFENDKLATYTHVDTITARGCHYACTFCNCCHYWGKKHRAVPVQRVIDEIRLLKGVCPRLRTVRFRDEAISLNRRRCLELCDELTKADFGLAYHAHSRIDTLDEEVIARLAQAGFKELYIGLESGSPAVLRRLRKGINIEKVRAMVPVLRRYGLAFRLSLIFWTPDETLDEAIETIELLRELDVGFEQLTISYGIDIYPGTAEAQRFLQAFPGYRWLERRELGQGYRQIYDSSGSVIGVSHCGATYPPQRLDEEINRRLVARLRASGEDDYRKLKYAMYTTDLMAARLGGRNGVNECARRFLDVLDETGAPWGICGDGHFYTTVLREAVEAGRFKHFVGRFPVRGIPGTREVEVEGDMADVEYLVLGYTVNDGRSNAVANHLFDRRRFAGVLLLPAQLLLSLDDRDALYGAAPGEILKRAIFVPKYRPVTGTGRLAVPRPVARRTDRKREESAMLCEG